MSTHESMARMMEDMSRHYGMLAVRFRDMGKGKITPQQLAHEWTTRTEAIKALWDRVRVLVGKG